MQAPCPYCRATSALFLKSRDYNRRITKEIFNHYRCPQCGLIFISPVPRNLNIYYPGEYYFPPDTAEFPTTLDVIAASAVHEQYKIDIIRRYVRQGRLLEIGPAFGAFAYLAKQSGFETQAIEMDANCSRFLNEALGIPTVNSSDACAALKALKPFDVIILWHVIEHLQSPWETLEAVSAKLNPGGILVMAAPNPASFQFRILGRYWWHLDAPRHLMLIPAPLLKDKMATLGMSAELITTRDEGSIGSNLLGWVHSFLGFCRCPWAEKILRKLGYEVTKLVRPLEEKEGSGSTYLAVFRKAAA